MRTFKDVKVGDKIYIIGWCYGGYNKISTIASIKNDDEDLVFTTEEKNVYRVYADMTHDWDNDKKEDVYVDAESAFAMSIVRDMGA